MKHIILASNYRTGRIYADKLGLYKTQVMIVGADDQWSAEKLAGLVGEFVLHRTQSWYCAGWTNSKLYIRDVIQARLVGRPNISLTVLNEVAVTNTTFLS